MISTANLARIAYMPRSDLIKFMTENAEALAGATAEAMADELIANRNAFDFAVRGASLAPTPGLILT